MSQQLPTEFAERQLAEGKTLRTDEGSDLELDSYQVRSTTKVPLPCAHGFEKHSCVMHLDFWDYLTFASLAKKRWAWSGVTGRKFKREASWTEEI